MINAVFDSSVLIAAFLTPKGLSRSLIQRAQVGQFKLSISQEIVAETRQKLIKSNKLRERYRYADEEVAYFINGLRTLSIVVQDLPAIQVVRDSSDDIIMATAIKAEADYLVTRDEDLLALGTYESIQIVLPEQFLTELNIRETP